MLNTAQTAPKEEQAYEFTPKMQHAIEKAIEPLNANIPFDVFVQYLIAATQAREAVKFEFTRNLSRALDYFIDFGTQHDIARESLSYLTFDDFMNLKNGNLDINNIYDLIEMRKNDYRVTQLIELPQLIFSEQNFYCFERSATQPNFITNLQIEADVVALTDTNFQDIANSIVMIPQADPGYDWLFGHNIAGLITKYGGANSHMAIRAAEMGLPAVIGAGDQLFEQVMAAKRVQLNCAQQLIRCIR